ncbi:MAG TPA: pyridoxamine 5'-phosphate oxidase family protein [Vicinamibacterales bacterium]|jgi:nitroimidazol reductase NimA-like FMN-containing flavoprotein (pyridoxamine 5'-phosphate oxidase superfamily)
MRILELTSSQCLDILSRVHLGRLGCAHDNQPYIIPIHFSFDADRHCVYAFSTIGQKIEWMRQNPKVCLEIEDIADKDHWTTVVVFGRYEEIHQSPKEAEARRRAERLFQERREWWLPAAGRLRSGERHEMVVYRIQIDRVTGRRAARDRT